MNDNLIARASMTTHASNSRVWNALVNPEAIREYMSGAVVTTNWKEGGAIAWKGDWRGRPYEITGTILKMVPRRRMQFTHSRLRAADPDTPEIYQTVTIDLSHRGRETDVLLSQDKNPSESVRDHSEKNWEILLAALKKYVEK
jgi:uncharacterized protein YndB with AHSA1/START domain